MNEREKDDLDEDLEAMKGSFYFLLNQRSALSEASAAEIAALCEKATDALRQMRADDVEATLKREEPKPSLEKLEAAIAVAEAALSGDALPPVGEDGDRIKSAPFLPNEEMKWLVRGWIPRACVGQLVGIGGAGKSALALQLGVCVAGDGGEWLEAQDDTPDGRAAAQRLGTAVLSGGAVVYASWEDKYSDIRRRIGDNPPDKLFIANMRGLGPIWGVPEHAHTLLRGELLPAGAWLRDQCERKQARLLIIDPRAAAFGLNENDRAQVREFMASWDAWAETANCTVIIITHPAKDAAAEEAGVESGSTDWRNASRFVLGLLNEVVGKAKDRRLTNRRLLRATKINHAMPPPDLYLHRNVDKPPFLWLLAMDQEPTPDRKKPKAKPTDKPEEFEVVSGKEEDKEEDIDFGI